MLKKYFIDYYYCGYENVVKGNCLDTCPQSALFYDHLKHLIDLCFALRWVTVKLGVLGVATSLSGGWDVV